MSFGKLAARRLAGALGLLLALSLVLAPVPILAAIPPPSGHVFYGNAYSEGEPVAPETAITVIVAELEYYTTVDAEGRYGWEPILNIPADNPGTTEIEGASPNDPIEFYIGETKANLYDVEADEWLESYSFAIGGLTVLNLETTRDVTPPAVVSTTPETDVTDVAIDAPVTATFDEDVTAVDLSGITIDGVTVVPTLDEATDTITIAHDDFAQGTQYTVTIPAGAVQDLATNPNAEYTWSFTTVGPDVTPPSVESTSPADSAVSVAIDAPVTATFDEDVTTVDLSGITIDGVTVVPTLDEATDTITIAHDDFAQGTQYTVTIPAGAVQDLATNPNAEYTWSFTTRAEGPISFTTTLPAGWNLLSTPIKLDAGSDAVEQILSESLANIEASWRWDVQSQQWAVPTGYELSPLEAIYLKVTSGAEATAEFVPYPDYSALPSRELQPGLNLIGPAPALGLDGFPDTPLDEALISIAEAEGSLTGYTMVVSPGLNQTGWAYALGGEIQDLLPFKGYWVVMENADTLYGFSTTPIP